MKIMSYKYVSFIYSDCGNRLKYHCYMYSEQATENMPAES